MLRNGDIIEFPLSPYINLFGYTKLIDLSVGNPTKEYHNPYRWFVYNYFSNKRLDDLKKLEYSNLLCNPLLMYWSKSIKKLNGWRIIGNMDVNSEEYKNRHLRYIPNDFYETEPIKYSELNWICCLESESNFNSKENWKEYPYEHIRHLEGSGSTDVSSLPLRTFLEKCKLNGELFDVSAISENEWYGAYIQCLDIPAYDLIPPEYRQTPIPKNVPWKWPDDSRIYFNYYDRKK